MRHIVLDTETTGLSYSEGHRIIEIGCIELIDRKFSGNHFHVYLNPEREVDAGAFRVHGISTQFLQDKPRFKDIANDLIRFIDQSSLIIHNATFDVGFLNHEFSLLNLPTRVENHCSVIDTLELARQKHPGQRNNLDALCKRYHVDNSNRELHGALLDAEILAFVYLAMTGGQKQLFANEPSLGSVLAHDPEKPIESLLSASPVYYANEEELQRHREFVEKFFAST